MTDPGARPPWPRGPCGKVAYTSRRAAKAAHAHAGFTIRLYRCATCGDAWHATNRNKSTNKHRAKRRRKKETA